MDLQEARDGAHGHVTRIDGAGPLRALFWDVKANVYALDAETGAVLWQMQADPYPYRPHHADRHTDAIVAFDMRRVRQWLAACCMTCDRG